MNVTQLNDAMQYIDDPYLDLADAPQKEIIQMTRTKTISKIFLIAAIVAMLAVTACAADLLHVKSLFSGTKSIYEAFPEMEKAMDEAGFRIDVKEHFRTGYSFEEVNVKEIRGEDENDQEVLTYSAISVLYRNADGKYLALTAEPEMPELSVIGHPAAQSREFDGIEVDYYVEHYKFVPEDYEPTEAEKAWMEQPGNYISYGSDEVEETAVSFLVWIKDGLHYSLMDIRGTEKPEAMFAMAEELITAG